MLRASDSSDPIQHDALAMAAVEPIEPGMLVGLGTGRTATRGIHALAYRVHEEGLSDVTCVATSEASREMAEGLGLKVGDFAMVERVHYTFDGADEVDHQLRVLKGSGGAMTRERLIAWASDRTAYMVREQKIVETLGTNVSLAVAVMAFGLASIRAELRHRGLAGVCRRTLDGQLFVTDNGNLIVDVGLEGHDCEDVAATLDAIPGVVDHGLFIHEADEVLVEAGDGEIKRMAREE